MDTTIPVWWWPIGALLLGAFGWVGGRLLQLAWVFFIELRAVRARREAYWTRYHHWREDPYHNLSPEDAGLSPEDCEFNWNWVLTGE